MSPKFFRCLQHCFYRLLVSGAEFCPKKQLLHLFYLVGILLFLISLIGPPPIITLGIATPTSIEDEGLRRRLEEDRLK